MSHTTNIAFTTSLVTPKSCFLINLIYILYHLMKFTNHIPRVGHAISVNLLLSLAKMVSPIYNTPAQYRLAHTIRAFLVLSHCIYSTYTPFLRDNLKVTHATPIPTSPFNRYVLSEGNKPSNPNSSLVIIPIFLIMVIFPLTLPDSRLQNAYNYALQMVITNLLYSFPSIFGYLPFML